MPRQARLDAPGVLHHIMIRGIERRKIFINDRDRGDFLDRLAKLLPETQTACYAWVFIQNHAHFLFRTGVSPLATVMRRLLTGYAVSFNRRHKRHGQLFQNRYKCTASNNGCSGVDLSKMGGNFIEDISFLEMFEESADAVL